MLGPFVEFRICFFQAVRIVALERSFNFMDQRIDLTPDRLLRSDRRPASKRCGPPATVRCS